MEHLSDLAIILKTFPYQERDKVVVFLTENYGRRTALAKGGVHSRRFGGTLDFLSCSRMEFVQKPHAEMGRIDEAVIHHEFRNLEKDFERLTAASFAAEFCLKLIEPQTPSREMFVLLSNMLFQLDAGMALKPAINAFLCKAFKVLGYPPSLLRCVQCERGAHEIAETGCRYYWYSEAGGMICGHCSKGRFKSELGGDTLLLFHRMTMVPFKELGVDQVEIQNSEHPQAQLYRLLSDFLHHHIPGLPTSGLKSWKLLNDALMMHY